MPSSTSALASPRSPSRNSTRLPAAASPVARLRATLVLPTPPLPPVTAITCTGPGRVASRDGMGDSSEATLQQLFVDPGGRARAGAEGTHHELVGTRRRE